MKRVVLIVAATTMPHALCAQSPVDTTGDRLGTHGIEYWAGYSARSPKLGFLGNRPGMSFGMTAVRVSNRIRTTETYALDYTIDVVPLAMSSPPLGYDMFGDTLPAKREPRPNCLMSFLWCRFPDGSAQGAGFSPVGLTFTYRRDRVLQPRLGATGGVLFFDREVPTIQSAKLNFTATIEAGAQLLTKSGDGVVFVYRFHHLSNAGTGYDNSALASHVISLGARFGSWNP